MNDNLPLPEFKSPPIDEVGLGLQFERPKNWAVPYFGIYWNQIRSTFPRTETHQPLLPQVEQSSPLVPQTFQFYVPEPRCWFLTPPGNDLIQLQGDRFMRNWRRMTGTEEYPRYAALRPTFESDWERARSFFETENLGAPTITQCEINYINHIEKGQGWENINDLRRVTPLWNESTIFGFSGGPETASINLSYSSEKPGGRLWVMLSHALRVRDGKEILQISLAARGRPSSSKTEDLLAWMDAGREWIVRAFADVTTPEMHKMWGRIR